MKKLLGATYRPVNPSPAALITSIDETGRPNILTLGEVFNISISKPVIVGIAIRPATFSHSLIRKTGEFVINLTTSGIVDKVDLCGSATGRDGFDKFTEYGLTALPATYVKPPLIKECPVNIECKVISIQRVGDHDMVLGEVMGVHADEQMLDPSGRIDLERLDLLVYLSGSYWSLGRKIEDHGFTIKKL
jgi:flavin reductase (DIM6/NTAB) family NADH-FMN oxidoreductase RutF